MARQRARPSRGVDGNRRAETFFATVVLNSDAANVLVFKQHVRRVSILEHIYTSIDRSPQQALIHLCPAESQRAVRRSKPGTGNASAFSGARIENGFAQRGRARGEHLIRDA